MRKTKEEILHSKEQSTIQSTEQSSVQSTLKGSVQSNDTYVYGVAILAALAIEKIKNKPMITWQLSISKNKNGVKCFRKIYKK